MTTSAIPFTPFWQRRRLPVLLQAETAECALACVAMIASYWGHRTDISAMRRRFSVSLKGASLRGVMAMAAGLGLQSRPLKAEIAHLPELKLPCVLHWDLNHFVVLKSVGPRHAVIVDPALGERRLALAQLAAHFTGVALEMNPAADFKPAVETRPFTLTSLMGRVSGLERSLVQILALGLVLQLCSLIAPFYMQWVVDEALLAYDRDLVTVLGCGFLLLVLLQASITAVRSWATTVMATELNIQWLGNTFAHLLKLPLSYFEKRHTGDVVSRFQSIQSIQNSLTTQFVEGVIDGVLVLGTLAMMLWYSPTLTAAAGVAVAVYVLIRLAMFRSLRDATAEQIVHAAKQQTHFIESVRGIQSIRLFGAGEERRASWLNSLVDQFNAELRVARLGVSYHTANFLLFNIERVAVIWLAALAVMDGRFSVGMLFAFISYKDQFSQRITSLIDKLFELRMLRLHGERVADIILTEAEEETLDSETDWNALAPTIELRNVSFRYADGEPLVLNQLSLVIPAGQCVAITGPSGCGKTTLMKLLLGLLEPVSGEILIGGIKLQQLGLSNYRRMLGTVMQDDTLFSGTLGDNICFFTPRPDRQRIEHCAQLAAVHAEIVQMPMGFNTLIGDIGTGLSGGQRQRILLARALYRDPRILVLDEATSHLDVWNEQQVNAAIRDIALTRVIVAHRPETIAMAQRVIVLQQGAMVQDVMQPTQWAA